MPSVAPDLLSLAPALRGRKVYVASPYNHPDPAVRIARTRLVARATGHLIEAGAFAYSPVAHSSLIVELGCPVSEPIWAAHGLGLLPGFEVLLVLEMQGTSESRGVAAEIEGAERLGIEIMRSHITPGGGREALDMSDGEVALRARFMPGLGLRREV